MTPEFSTAFSNRLTALTSGLLFDNTAIGEKKAPQVIETMLPPKGSSYQEFGEFPLVCWAAYNGKIMPRQPWPFGVVVTGGIYTPGSIADGSRDITALAMALAKLVDDRAFPPYRLDVPIDLTIGDSRDGYEGLQPHPVYWLTMHMRFLVSK